MSRRFELRKRLFEIYSAQLGSIFPKYKGLYACPLCMRLFDSSNINEQKPGYSPLTLDHIPPRALGGKKRVMVCAECNSKIGSGPDASLSTKVAWERAQIEGQHTISKTWSKGLGFVLMELKHKDQSVIVRVSSGPQQDAVAIKPDPKLTNRDVYLDIIKKTKAEPFYKFQLSVPFGKGVPFNKSVDKASANASILRSGYLLAFDNLGYAYICLDQLDLDIVRQQIKDPQSRTEAMYAVVNLDEAQGLPEGLNFGMAVLENGQRCFASLINVKVGQGVVEKHAVFLPSPISNEKSVYHSLAELSASSAKQRMHFLPLNHHMLHSLLFKDNPMKALAELWVILNTG